jgi:hypothetical protein
MFWQKAIEAVRATGIIESLIVEVQARVASGMIKKLGKSQ